MNNLAMPIFATVIFSVLGFCVIRLDQLAERRQKPNSRTKWWLHYTIIALVITSFAILVLWVQSTPPKVPDRKVGN
jgi:uncharacterized membrane protein